MPTDKRATSALVLLVILLTGGPLDLAQTTRPSESSPTTPPSLPVPPPLPEVAVDGAGDTAASTSAASGLASAAVRAGGPAPTFDRANPGHIGVAGRASVGADDGAEPAGLRQPIPRIRCRRGSSAPKSCKTISRPAGR